MALFSAPSTATKDPIPVLAAQSAIKSIQRGLSTLDASNEQTLTVTISSINTTKSILNFSFSGSESAGATTNNYYLEGAMSGVFTCSGAITSATSIIFHQKRRISVSAQNSGTLEVAAGLTYLRWEVIEYV